MTNSLCAKNSKAVSDGAVQHTYLPSLLADKSSFFYSDQTREESCSLHICLVV